MNYHRMHTNGYFRTILNLRFSRQIKGRCDSVVWFISNFTGKPVYTTHRNTSAVNISGRTIQTWSVFIYIYIIHHAIFWGRITLSIMSSHAQKLRSSESRHFDDEAPAWDVTLQEKTTIQLKTHIRNEINDATETLARFKQNENSEHCTPKNYH